MVKVSLSDCMAESNAAQCVVLSSSLRAVQRTALDFAIADLTANGTRAVDFFTGPDEIFSRQWSFARQLDAAFRQRCVHKPLVISIIMTLPAHQASSCTRLHMSTRDSRQCCLLHVAACACLRSAGTSKELHQHLNT